MPKTPRITLSADGFRPSNLPKLEQCLHYVPKAVEGAAAKRGRELHELLERALRGELNPQTISDPDARETVVWALDQLAARGISVQGTEEELTLAGPDGEPITSGIIDAWGRTDDELWGVDFKSGDPRDYSAQFAAYGGALLMREGETRCAWLELYLDLRVANEYEIEVAEAEGRVSELHARFLEKDGVAPVANPYCDWCAARASCPVWLDDASRALAAVGPSSGEPFDQLVYEIERLKRDPVKLGQFYTAYRRLEKLVDEEWQIKKAISDHLENGETVPGYRLHRSPVQETVDVEQVLLQCAVPMGSVRAREFLTVSIPRLRQEWAKWTRDPLPVDIAQTAGGHHVRAEIPQGRGRAAAARTKRSKRREVLAEQGPSAGRR